MKIKIQKKTPVQSQPGAPRQTGGRPAGVGHGRPAGGGGSGPLLKRNVNIFLLMFILIIVTVGVFFSVGYQYRVKGLTTDYNSTKENLTYCRTDLSQCRATLYNTEVRLNSTEKDIKTYDNLYEEKETELEDKQKELTDSIGRANTLEAQLANSKSALEAEKSKSKSLETTITLRESEIRSLKEDKNDLNDVINCLEDKPDNEESSC